MPRRIAMVALIALLMTRPAAAEEVVVFAAASLKNALDAVAADFQADTGHQVMISYAGSNALARQILQEAPADVFVSAAVNWMDEVEKGGLVLARRDLLGNSLVLIARGKDAPAVSITPGFDLAGLLGDGKLSMAMVDAVPAGQYGKAALEALGVWKTVEGAVAQSENTRAALALVSAGEAPFGIVYATDAVADDNVTVVGTFPADSHGPIIYPAALLRGASDAADRAFFQALSSDKAAARFREYGFRTLD
ncbi:MAG: molybdate ABC transporter substrate-binding protein [Rhodobacter sp.]|nr:molybdate ABC transporter substrate-binding protein [Rhodobacter sp.]MCA3458646.1 molybdate ABC transporter substrate-binding protein [Rhodobacter sp.]MCA3459557.1 molybdate ABC transporter substrate-binding protein [Rhodobacter sp.]MCA3465223.1 molybdate ABC transporter substrate-binding protein [Rhodobacter sp.]MCA3466974.1 molybdate ABC transporter substrate-binding protein [Rhodobacter sp.]